MEQLPLFNQSTVRIWHERKAGKRRRLVSHFAWVEDEHGDTIIGVEYEGIHFSGLKAAIIQKAREAFMKDRERPFGDEYMAGPFHVYYIYEKRD